jgi:hypothetical protein
MWEVTDFTVMRKTKWLFLKGCECKRPIYTAVELLSSWADETNTSEGLQFMLTNNDTLRE